MFTSFIPIRIWIKRKKTKEVNQIYKRSIEDSDNNNEKKNSLAKSYLIIILSRYINGYIRYSLLKVGFIPSHRIRNFLYRNIYLINMDEKAILYYGAELREPYKLHIGQGSIIGDKSTLDARNGIFIGKNVNFSTNVSIWTEQHDYKDPYFKCNSNPSFAVTIKDNVWIGPNVTILPGVTIGEGAVLGAGAVVTKDIEPYTLYGGIPAKKITNRPQNILYQFDGSYIPFL